MTSASAMVAARIDSFMQATARPWAAGLAGEPVASFTHESFGPHERVVRGGTCSGSSSEDVVMSRVPEESASIWNVKGVPHEAQKVRVACSEDLKCGRAHRTGTETTPPARWNQATNGAPLVFDGRSCSGRRSGSTARRRSRSAPRGRKHPPRNISASSALRSMGVMVGDRPAWMVPRDLDAMPFVYNGTFLRLDDSR